MRWGWNNTDALLSAERAVRVLDFLSQVNIPDYRYRTVELTILEHRGEPCRERLSFTLNVKSIFIFSYFAALVLAESVGNKLINMGGITSETFLPMNFTGGKYSSSGLAG